MNIKALLVLSLAANVLLAAVLMRKSQETPTAPPPVAQPDAQSAEEKKSEVESPKVAPQPATAVRTNQVTRTFGWEAVESADYKEYIANLRSVGCPEETIRDIIVADVNKLYDAKKKAVGGEKKEFEFWKPGNPFMASMNTEKMEGIQKLEKEKNDLLRALGIEPDIRSTAMSVMTNPFETMMDFLPEDKRTKVMEVMMDYQTKMAKAAEGGQPLPEDIGKVQKEMEAAIAAMLTPEENFDFQMRFSMTANMLRQSVAGFDPSKEEFVKVFNLRKEFDDQHSIFGRGEETPEQRKQRQEDDKIFKDALKDALGEDRYADYEMAQDWTFRQANTAAKRTGLDSAVAKEAWQMRKAAEDQARELRKNKEMQKEQRDAALAAIRLESENAIKGLYGEDGWKNYSRGNGASWLDRIYKKPKPAGN